MHLAVRLLLLAPLCVGLACGDDHRPTPGARPTDSGASYDATLPGPRDSGIVPDCDPFVGPDGADDDDDGFTRGQGDCNDCDPAANPGAFDFPDNGADEDCRDGDATGDVMVCDGSLPMGSTQALDGARAIGLCKMTTEASREWGVISARYTSADGSSTIDSSMQLGLLPAFGVSPAPVGASLLALSSGIARDPGQPGYTSECDYFGAEVFGLPFSPPPTPFPDGFPVESPSCPGVTTGPVFNAAALEVRVRVPTNARSLSFASNFYTYEYPEFICSEFNDFFVALLEPRPEGLVNDNIVFDNSGDLVSVNSSLLEVCEPGTHGGKTFTCPSGTELLSGTGFDATASCGTGEALGYDLLQSTRAATGWLRTTAPVRGGSIITLRFAIWDSGDPDLDSTVLVDGFEWEVEEAEVTTEPDPLI